MIRRITLLSCMIICIILSSKLSAQAPYKATWESLDSHKMPAWYDDAKVGLSMHWGVYSVPAWAPRDKEISYAEWYGNNMDDKNNPTYEYHRQKYGNDFTYDQ